ncbi:MAG: PhnD/SsuA/transferrin family substrate-binding protein [Myxococcota bacterium]
MADGIMILVSHMASCDDPWLERLAEVLGVELRLRPENDSGAHFVWMCGLPYVRGKSRGESLEPICAPAYVGGPDSSHYWSEVIGRVNGPSTPTRTSRWAVNGFDSNSGYLMPRARFALDATQHTGSHAASIECLQRGEVEFAAIDGHVWERAKTQNPAAVEGLRSVRRIGPSPSPPWLATRLASEDKRRGFSHVLRSWASEDLVDYGIRRFFPVTDAHYDSIRDLDAKTERSAEAPHH